MEILELDATLLGGHLASLTTWLHRHAGEQVQSVVDVGAGLGGGSLALAERFPAAKVFAVDRSEQMLERVQTSAAERGFSGRISTVLADLDEAWPALAGADLAGADIVWASSSLHEVADPARVFADIFAALKPGGLLAVVELADLPWFLPEDVGLGRPGLEARAHQVLSDLGWNRQLEWQQLLARAGFELIEKAGFSAGGAAR